MSNDNKMNEQVIEYVTVMIGGQLFGLPISRVQDVFMPDRVTRVPLSAPEIAGVLNLRGRIVTAIDMRARLGLPLREGGKPMCAVIEHGGQPYALVVDAVGDVVRVPAESHDGNPVMLSPVWRAVASGVYRLDELMVAVDIDALFASEAAEAA